MVDCRPWELGNHAKPKRARTESELPRLRKSKQLAPQCVPWPMRSAARIEIVEPSCTKSKTDSEPPRKSAKAPD